MEPNVAEAIARAGEEAQAAGEGKDANAHETTYKSHRRVEREDILASPTMYGLSSAKPEPNASIAEYFQAVDNFCRVFAFRPGEKVLMLFDSLIDPRVVQALSGLAKARGAQFTGYMAQSTTLSDVPEEVKPLVENADFVVSTWFQSVIHPFFIDMRRKRGQRWVKITFFRNLDLLHTPRARFPLDLLGEIVRGTRDLFPTSGEFDLCFTDVRGSDLSIHFTQEMRKNMLATTRWQGNTIADEPGCYIHYIATHGPNLYDRNAFKEDRNPDVTMSGTIYPQWAVGFEKPFEEKIGVRFESDRIVAVEGVSREAQILRDMLIGGQLIELGCGHNPKWPRFEIYPAGPNSPGGLHFGIDLVKPSDYIRKVMPDWEEPPVHMDLVTFDTTVTAGSNTLIDEGFLVSLKSPKVVKLAEQYGDPFDLLEGFPQ
jgi:hypothetical protein